MVVPPVGVLAGSLMLTVRRSRLRPVWCRSLGNDGQDFVGEQLDGAGGGGEGQAAEADLDGSSGLGIGGDLVEAGQSESRTGGRWS